MRTIFLFHSANRLCLENNDILFCFSFYHFTILFWNTKINSKLLRIDKWWKKNHTHTYIAEFCIFFLWAIDCVATDLKCQPSIWFCFIQRLMLFLEYHWHRRCGRSDFQFGRMQLGFTGKWIIDYYMHKWQHENKWFHDNPLLRRRAKNKNQNNK